LGSDFYYSNLEVVINRKIYKDKNLQHTMESLEATMEKVELEGRSGFMHYSRIPLKIYFQTGSETFDLINARNPAAHMVTPDLGGGQSLSVWVHESVPTQYVDNVMYHELVEAELGFNHDISNGEAHKHAVQLEYQYVEKIYGKEKLAELKNWQRENLDNY
tara:strand:- start:106 stop:588 length:483 start_codon:yes stop_codon:yes gene_type:complete